MPYQIEISAAALAELKAARAYNQRQIAKAIEQQLASEPSVETRNRKPIVGIKPDFDHVPPIWELRVGNYRVFYDVDEVDKIVSVRAVRQKPPHARTEEIL